MGTVVNKQSEISYELGLFNYNIKYNTFNIEDSILAYMGIRSKMRLSFEDLREYFLEGEFKKLEKNIEKISSLGVIEDEYIILRNGDKEKIIICLHYINYEEIEEIIGICYGIKNNLEIDDFDLLSGISNELFIKNKIDDIIKKNNRYRSILCLLDLDNFKLINNTFGYEIGSNVIQEVWKRLSSLNDENHFAFRYSGDEFIIFASNLKSIDEINKYGQKIINIFKESFQVEDLYIDVTASIGITIWPDNGKRFYELLRNADKAVCSAKLNGKNSFYLFDDKIDNRSYRFYEVQKDIKKALDKEELYIVFQPKVILNNCKVIGFEALLRWNSAELGNVSPSEFIPVAENTRMIIPIGRFVLEEVFKKVKELIENGYSNFKIAVNISEVQLINDDLIFVFKELIKKYMVSPRYIELEITESVLIRNFEQSIAELRKIKEIGVSIALDDFGTGYSSLSYLLKLPIDVLKLDRSFVSHLPQSTKNRCIVQNIIQLSHELGMEVVAEGVEELNQIEYLKHMNCDIVQGYYYSKPKEFHKIYDMLGKKLVVN